MKTKLREVREQILEAERIAVIPHSNPDGDAVGASLGLSLFLTRAGKEVETIFPTPPPEHYRFLEGLDELLVKQELSPAVDLVVFLDCANPDRCLPFKLPAGFSGQTINIDHHEDNNHFGNLNLVLPDASSSGEIVYLLCEEFDEKLAAREAAALLVSLLSDTGDFHFSNTSPRTLRIAAALLEAGAEIKKITYRLFESTVYRRVKLLGLVLATLEKTENGEIVWVRVTREMMKTTGTDSSAVEDFVNQISRIEDVKIALLFREEARLMTKVSIRSVAGIKANKIAAGFDGGGHAAAAGCRLNETLERSVPLVIRKCEEALAGF